MQQRNETSQHARHGVHTGHAPVENSAARKPRASLDDSDGEIIEEDSDEEELPPAAGECPQPCVPTTVHASAACAAVGVSADFSASASSTVSRLERVRMRILKRISDSDPGPDPKRSCSHPPGPRAP